MVRLYQCNPLVSQPASRSSYLNGHHFPEISISQKPATIRHRLGNVKTSHSPVPQILYWSQSERLSWSASGPVLRRAYRALELGRPPVRLYVRQASAVRFIPNIKAVTRAHTYLKKLYKTPQSVDGRALNSLSYYALDGRPAPFSGERPPLFGGCARARPAACISDARQTCRAAAPGYG